MIRVQGNSFLSFILERRVAHEEAGQALVEYALILALITVVTIAVLQSMGVDISKILDKASTSLSAIAG